jgi:hypothetical protein
MDSLKESSKKHWFMPSKNDVLIDSSNFNSNKKRPKPQKLRAAEPSKADLNNTGGWLGFLIIMLSVLSPLYGLFVLFSEFKITDEGAIFTLIYTLGLISLSILAGIFLEKKKSFAVRFTKIYLITLLGINIFTYIFYPEAYYGNNLFNAFVMPLAWTLYLYKSIRVKTVYGALKENAEGANIWATLSAVYVLIFPFGLIFVIVSLVKIHKHPKLKGKKLSIIMLVLMILLTLIYVVLFTVGYMVQKSESCESPMMKIGLRCCIPADSLIMCQDEEAKFLEQVELTGETTSYGQRYENKELNFSTKLPENYFLIQNITIGGVDIAVDLSAPGESNDSYTEILISYIPGEIGNETEKEFSDIVAKGMQEKAANFEIIDEYDVLTDSKLKGYAQEYQYSISSTSDVRLYQKMVVFFNKYRTGTYIIKFTSTPGYEGYVTDLDILIENFKLV